MALQRTNEWRTSALHYEEFGCYTKHTKNPAPNSPYMKFWKEEKRRCKEGYHCGWDYIPGYYYFYLNYSPIIKAVALEELSEEELLAGIQARAERMEGFPEVWDGDYDYFHYLEEAEKRGIHAAVLKTRGRGYEQPYSAIIKTPFGDKTMGEIQPGDLVCTPSWEPTVVLEKYEQGVKDVYEVTFSDGRKVNCGINHLWCVYKNNRKPYKVLTLREIIRDGLYYNTSQKQKVYKYKIPEISPVLYPEKGELPIHPYILGALLGDGSMSTANIKIASSDEEVLNQFQNILGNDYEIIYDSSTTNNYRITYKPARKAFIKNNPLKTAIKELGINKSCKNKFIPEIYKTSSISERMALVKGLMDTDGSINKDGFIEFTNSCEKLVDDLADVLRSLGISCKKIYSKRSGESFVGDRKIKRNNYYRLYIHTNFDLFTIKRKSDRVRNKRLFGGAFIKSIEKIGREQSACILIQDDEHVYLTNDFVPTHNSFKGASMLNRNFFLFPNSKSYAIASEKEYLIKDGIISKAWSNMNFIDQNTPWKKLRQVKNGDMHRRASYLEGGVEKGYMSEIIGITLKDNPQKARGKRGKLILWEEAGNFPNLLKAWQIARPSLEQGSSTFGLMVAFGTGGCLTAGNKVWDATGNLVNIEDLNIANGIIGFKENEGFSKERVTYWQKPTNKYCVRIETNTGRWIECSLDHPIYKRLIGKNGITVGNKFVEASDLKIKDDIAVIENVNIWSDRILEDARTIGWLIGDGTYGKDQSVRFSNCEEEILEYIENKYDCTVTHEYKTKLNKIYKELRIRNYCKLLRACGIYGQTKRNKRLPNNIHSYSKESVCEFLGGLFDTDGYISFRENKSRPGKYIGEISISQSSKEILYEIQLLLQKLGIHSSIRERKARLNKKGPIKGINNWFELCVRDRRSLISFCENIQLYPKEKQNRLDKILKYSNTILTGRGEFKGLRYERIVKIERTGIKPVYNLTASNTNTYIGNGIITHNTEGSNFVSLEKLFYKPEAYKVHAIPNRWDENKENTKCGFFHGEQTNSEGYYDKDGNSNEETVKEAVLRERENLRAAGIDQNSLMQMIAEKPLCPSEAVLRTSGFYFPVHQLKQQLSLIEGNPEKYINPNWIGRLEFDDETGILNWRPDPLLRPHREWPGDIEEGAVEIYEMPQKNAAGVIPYNTYIAGCDPVDRQTTDYTESLGSIFVMNRWTRRIVAEYTGRPDNPRHFHEICRRLAMFYNATVMYENQLSGIFTHFEQKRCLHLLADTPKLLRDNITFREGTNVSKGVPASTRTNEKAREYIKSWLLDPIAQGSEILNYQKLRSIGALKELISWNIEDNFDRVSALGMLLLYDETLYKPEQEVVKKVKTLIDDPYWKEMGLITDNPSIVRTKDYNPNYNR